MSLIKDELRLEWFPFILQLHLSETSVNKSLDLANNWCLWCFKKAKVLIPRLSRLQTLKRTSGDTLQTLNSAHPATLILISVKMFLFLVVDESVRMSRWKWGWWMENPQSFDSPPSPCYLQHLGTFPFVLLCISPFVKYLPLLPFRSPEFRSLCWQKNCWNCVFNFSSKERKVY